MAQKKTAKELELELQAAQEMEKTAQEAAKKIEKDLAEARKVEAEKVAKAKAAAEKRAKKSVIKRKAELDTILVDYEDVLVPAPMPSVKPAPTAPKPVATVINTNPPAPKQESEPEKPPKSLIKRFWDSL